MTKVYRTHGWVAAWFAAVMIAAVTARADYEAGQVAWDAGRHVEAVAAWQEAAQANDARAMLALGRAFVQGLGVPQDFVEAHKWLNLAAGLGDAEAAAERDTLATDMTVEERAEARKLARAWRTEGTPASAGAEPQESLPAPAGPPSSVEAPPARAVREAQQLLAALGYAPGPLDGLWGQRSVEAYRSFLGDNGMELADVLTPQTLRTMRGMARAAAGATEAREVSPGTLHRAVQAGNLDALTAAVSAGTDVNQRDGQGWTALMHAANKGYVLLVPPLLEAGADLDLRAPDGATALFMATALGHTGIIALLMEAGADTAIPGPRGKTAVDVAKVRYGDAETARNNGESWAVLALIQGMTFAEAEELARLATAPGTTFRDCEVCPEMVVVPSGSFMMGSPASEKGRSDYEEPVHRVTIPTPFAVGKYEVTFAEWDACGAAGGCGGFVPPDWQWGRGDRPVINVSWRDAEAYVRWLSQRTGEQYRLLSEAEWEYAARAGSQTRYAWGDDMGRGRANCDGCGSRWGDTSTAPVGSFSPNAFGLHDMHGNVREWVSDCWNADYAGAPEDGEAWLQGDCERRGVRDGSWNHFPAVLRSAVRYWYRIDRASPMVGFRVTRPIAP